MYQTDTVRGSVEVELYSPVGLTRMVKYSRSGLARKTKRRLISIMGDLDLTIPRYIDDYTQADLIDMIWDRVIHRARA